MQTKVIHLKTGLFRRKREIFVKNGYRYAIRVIENRHLIHKKGHEEGNKDTWPSHACCGSSITTGGRANSFLPGIDKKTFHPGQGWCLMGSSRAAPGGRTNRETWPGIHQHSRTIVNLICTCFPVTPCTGLHDTTTPEYEEMFPYAGN
jgi:hypothetical protein